jgi:hypothetical protein
MPRNATEKSARISGLDWDAWRNAYPTLTYAEQQAFHTAIYEAYPVQRHYDTDLVAKAIDHVQPGTVLELGGWDGELAQAMLEQYPMIGYWINFEICREAAAAGSDLEIPRYSAPILNDWYWTKGPWRCDLFVASHVIEHLTLEHLALTIEATKAKALFFDAPLLDRPINWQGSTTSHILTATWQQVTDLCAKHGYDLAWSHNHNTGPETGGHARAALYVHRGASK